MPPISLKNIYQVRIMKPDGKLLSTSPTRMEQSLSGVVGAAKWNVDPEGIPATLKTAWFHIEFGNFAMAANVLKKAGNSRKTDTKQGAQKLLDYVGEKMNKQIEAARTAETDGKVWEGLPRLFGCRHPLQGLRPAQGHRGHHQQAQGQRGRQEGSHGAENPGGSQAKAVRKNDFSPQEWLPLAGTTD